MDEPTLARLGAAIHDTALFLAQQQSTSLVLACAARAHVPQPKLAVLLRYLRALSIEVRGLDGMCRVRTQRHLKLVCHHVLLLTRVQREGAAMVVLPGNTSGDRTAAASGVGTLFRYTLGPDAFCLLGL